MSFKAQVQGIVGGVYRHALFYNFPGGLRFELSEGDGPLDQALSALRKFSRRLPTPNQEYLIR